MSSAACRSTRCLRRRENSQYVPTDAMQSAGHASTETDPLRASTGITTAPVRATPLIQSSPPKPRNDTAPSRNTGTPTTSASIMSCDATASKTRKIGMTSAIIAIKNKPRIAVEVGGCRTPVVDQAKYSSWNRVLNGCCHNRCQRARVSTRFLNKSSAGPSEPLPEPEPGPFLLPPPQAQEMSHNRRVLPQCTIRERFWSAAPVFDHEVPRLQCPTSLPLTRLPYLHRQCNHCTGVPIQHNRAKLLISS